MWVVVNTGSGISLTITKLEPQIFCDCDEVTY